MKLFELRPAKNLVKGDNPWDPWFDKYFGYVIRAENESEARKIAHLNEFNEDDDPSIFPITSHWLDEKYSTCIELTSGGDSGIIMSDFARA